MTSGSHLDDRDIASRTLYDISHVLAATRADDQRVRRVLELSRDLVPYDQCALLEVAAGRPSRVLVTPEPDEAERTGSPSG